MTAAGAGRLVRSAIATLGLVVIALVAVGVWIWSSAPQSNAGSLDFENEQIPPLAEPSVNEPGRKVFDLEIQEGRTELLPGKPAETWGINGPYLCPTLRAERGDEVTVNVAAGERADLVVAVRPGERVVSRSFEPDLGTDPFEGRFAGADDSFELLEIRAAQELDDSPDLPAKLVAQTAPDPRSRSSPPTNPSSLRAVPLCRAALEASCRPRAARLAIAGRAGSGVRRA